TQVDLGRRSAARLLVSASGTREHHQIRASVAGLKDSLVAALAGAWDERGWRGTINTLDLVNPLTGNWTLAAPAPLLASADDLSLRNFEWRSGGSRLDVAAERRRGEGWNVDAH